MLEDILGFVLGFLVSGIGCYLSNALKEVGQIPMKKLSKDY